MDPICLLSCALRLRTKYQFGKGIIPHRAGTRYKQSKDGHTDQLVFLTYESETPNCQTRPQPYRHPWSGNDSGICFQIWAVTQQNPSAHSCGTNHHCLDWFGRQHAGPHSCGSPVQKGLSQAPHAACTASSRSGGGKGHTLWQTVLPEQYRTSCFGPLHSLSPHKASPGRFFAWTPKDLFSIYGEKNEGEKWHMEGFQRGLQA